MFTLRAIHYYNIIIVIITVFAGVIYRDDGYFVSDKCDLKWRFKHFFFQYNLHINTQLIETRLVRDKYIRHIMCCAVVYLYTYPAARYVDALRFNAISPCSCPRDNIPIDGNENKQRN